MRTKDAWEKALQRNVERDTHDPDDEGSPLERALRQLVYDAILDFFEKEIQPMVEDYPDDWAERLFGEVTWPVPYGWVREADGPERFNVPDAVAAWVSGGEEAS